MNNEKPTKEQLKIAELKKQIEMWKEKLTVTTDKDLKKSYNSEIEKLEDELARLEEKENKKIAKAEEKQTSKTQEVEDIKPATKEQQKQAKGKLGKFKYAIAAVVGAGALFIAFLAGKKSEKDKNADIIAKQANINEPKVEQETQKSEPQTEVEKAVDKAIEETTIEEEPVASEEVENEIEDNVIEEPSVKEEEKPTEDNRTVNNNTNSNNSNDIVNNNGNNNSNTGGNTSESNNVGNETPSGNWGPNGTVTNVELVSDTGSEQHVEDETNSTDNGTLQNSTTEVVDNQVTEPNLDGGTVVNDNGSDNSNNNQSENVVTEPTQTETPSTSDNQATENDNSQSNEGNITEEIIDDQEVLPDIDPDTLAEIQALIDSQASDPKAYNSVAMMNITGDNTWATEEVQEEKGLKR